MNDRWILDCMVFGGIGPWINQNDIEHTRSKVERYGITVFLLIPGAEYFNSPFLILNFWSKS
jgi:hypothetical protein